MKTANQIKSDITNAFNRHISVPTGSLFQPIPKTLTAGKLYEAYILAILAQELTSKEGFDLVLSEGREIRLRSSPGPIDRRFPFIEVLNPLTIAIIAEIWTDIEFLTLSYVIRNSPKIEKGDYHELDIIMVDPEINDRPHFTNLWLGVECKNTPYKKSLLKEILGVRREMSLLAAPNATRFQVFPRSEVPANPPSCLIVYSSSSKVDGYTTPGEIFGIDFFYKPL